MCYYCHPCLFRLRAEKYRGRVIVISFFTSSPMGLALSSSRHALASVSLQRHTTLHQSLTTQTQWDSGMSDVAGRKKGGCRVVSCHAFPQCWIALMNVIFQCLDSTAAGRALALIPFTVMGSVCLCVTKIEVNETWWGVQWLKRLETCWVCCI